MADPAGPHSGGLSRRIDARHVGPNAGRTPVQGLGPAGHCRKPGGRVGQYRGGPGRQGHGRSHAGRGHQWQPHLGQAALRQIALRPGPGLCAHLAAHHRAADAGRIKQPSGRGRILHSGAAGRQPVELRIGRQWIGRAFGHGTDQAALVGHDAGARPVFGQSAGGHGHAGRPDPDGADTARHRPAAHPLGQAQGHRLDRRAQPACARCTAIGRGRPEKCQSGGVDRADRPGSPVQRSPGAAGPGGAAHRARCRHAPETVCAGLAGRRHIA